MARANLHLKKEVIQTKTPNTNGKFRVKKKTNTDHGKGATETTWRIQKTDEINKINK